LFITRYLREKHVFLLEFLAYMILADHSWSEMNARDIRGCELQGGTVVAGAT
jgi:hypothetical protein